MKSRSFILELSDKDIRTLAKALHIILLDDADNPDASEALRSLKLQADGVSWNAEFYSVYPVLEAPIKARNLKDVSYL